MSAKKYVTITGASKATATRDLQDLAERNILIPTGEGRGTRFWTNLQSHDKRSVACQFHKEIERASYARYKIRP